MFTAISFANVAFLLPDGRELFTGLDLAFGPERSGLIGRNGTGKTTLLKLISGELRPSSGTVTAKGRLRILQQAVQVRADETIADLFGVSREWNVLRRAEAGEATDEELAEVDWSLASRMAAALHRLGLSTTEPNALLTQLSGGQQTRARLAALIFDQPDFILLDEPTNNLDREGRSAVIRLLQDWQAGSIVVSHDRELLETMDAIVELTTLGATRYGGNWSDYRQAKDRELAAAQHDLAVAEKYATAVARQAQANAERQAQRNANASRKAAKGGQPRIIAGALKERGQNTAAAARRLATQRQESAHQALSAARAQMEILQSLRATLPPSHLPNGKLVLALDKVTAGYQPDRPVLRDLSFTLTGPERVAVTGPNGAGKSTLLALISGRLTPQSGSVRVHVPLVLLDQQAALLDPALTVRENFLRLNPGATENLCRAALARFMFPAAAALQSVSTLSGGQILRAGLACVFAAATAPQLLILDEPTNHLDLDSMQAVEQGLQGYDGALLIVSHDPTFLQTVGITRTLQITKGSGLAF